MSWLYAMYMIVATRHGVSGKEIQRQLGVIYMTAYRIGMRTINRTSLTLRPTLQRRPHNSAQPCAGKTYDRLAPPKGDRRLEPTE